MKTLFLLPPSEGKNSWWEYKNENTTFNFEKPCEIATSVTEKDLKCTWNRFQEWIDLNKSLCKWIQNEFTKALNRYSWVMFNNIDYFSMTEKWQSFFDDNFLIFSGMYGIVKPKDIIWDYKLPIETKGLYDYWWSIIPQAIIGLKPDCIVNLLPISYAKTIGLGTNCSKHNKKRNMILESWINIINVNFFKQDGKKISHWVKKVKWHWIRDICENNITDINKFWWEISETEKWLYDINITTN